MKSHHKIKKIKKAHKNSILLSLWNWILIIKWWIMQKTREYKTTIYCKAEWMKRHAIFWIRLNLNIDHLLNWVTGQGMIILENKRKLLIHYLKKLKLVINKTEGWWFLSFMIPFSVLNIMSYLKKSLYSILNSDLSQLLFKE
jgi:hypothetical protein